MVLQLSCSTILRSALAALLPPAAGARDDANEFNQAACLYDLLGRSMVAGARLAS